MKFRTMLSLAFLLFASATTFADVITFDFTGKVNGVHEVTSGTLPVGIAVGDSVTGNYSFDSEANDRAWSSETYGIYSIIGMQANIGSYSFSSSSGSLLVYDDYSSMNYSTWETEISDLYSVSGTSNGTSLGFNLTDWTKKLFEDDSIPPTPPSLSDFVTVNGYLNGPGTDPSSPFSLPQYIVNWDILTLSSSSQVPEPTSLLLLGTGLGVIGLAAWRKRK